MLPSDMLLPALSTRGKSDKDCKMAVCQGMLEVPSVMFVLFPAMESIVLLKTLPVSADASTPAQEVSLVGSLVADFLRMKASQLVGLEHLPEEEQITFDLAHRHVVETFFHLSPALQVS